MHIMFYYGSMQQGGAERVISSLANDFINRGTEVSILVLDEKPSLYPLDKKINYINLCANAHSSNVLDAVKNNARRIRLTREAFKKNHPDVVVCFGINNLTFALAAKRKLGIKTIGSERSNPYCSGEGEFWRKMKKLITPYADGYIFSTEGARSFYPEKTRKKSVVIPNGVFANTIPANAPALKNRCRQSICSAGRLETVKGFDTLIKAFALFHESFPHYTLHIYGSGTQKPALEKLILEKNLGKYVYLEGYAADVPAVLCKHTMFVFTSRHEGMPNSLIEALACGLPCVATNCDFGPDDLIKNGENGLLARVDDVEEIAGAMKRIARDKVFAEKISQNALQIRETHSMEKISQRFYDYISQVAKR